MTRSSEGIRNQGLTTSEKKWAEGGRLLTSRPFAEQLNDLGLNADDLKGKRILVLGPGKDFDFEMKAVEAGAEMVVPVSYSFDQFDESKVLNDTKVLPVAAHFNYLPFREASFNLILSDFAFPMYAYAGDQSDENIERIFTQVIELMEPGSQARFFPLGTEGTPEGTGEVVDMAEKVRRILSDKFGNQIAVELVKNRNEQMPDIESNILVLTKKLPDRDASA